MAANVAVAQDPAGDLKPAKKSTEYALKGKGTITQTASMMTS